MDIIEELNELHGKYKELDKKITEIEDASGKLPFMRLKRRMILEVILSFQSSFQEGNFRLAELKLEDHLNSLDDDLIKSTMDSIQRMIRWREANRQKPSLPPKEVENSIVDRDRWFLLRYRGNEPSLSKIITECVMENTGRAGWGSAVRPYDQGTG